MQYKHHTFRDPFYPGTDKPAKPPKELLCSDPYYQIKETLHISTFHKLYPNQESFTIGWAREINNEDYVLIAMNGYIKHDQSMIDLIWERGDIWADKHTIKNTRHDIPMVNCRCQIVI